ncbi:tsr1414 [Thermosynechococcus vestitus BP-1]|uniref:Tsr1414 protein n=1 Tax=Thermosynechococcus vestitus (strain NIES-2133 / IAM M-273 / BP-1) TaxID=197221 RepID=Q8DJ17_THEVB|nr:tsr1414 [Thermosynechococcus vestitus BP-1]
MMGKGAIASVIASFWVNSSDHSYLTEGGSAFPPPWLEWSEKPIKTHKESHS